jgi:hypothetical protein
MGPVPEGAPGAAAEPGLEQRLEALEKTVRRLTDANAWRRLLDEHVPAGERVAVLANQARVPSEALGRPVAGIVPDTEGSAAGVARLEAQRTSGARFVFVPQAARGEVEQDAHLTEHLRTRFRAMISDPEAGTLFEAAAPTTGDDETRALGSLIDSLGSGDRLTPILDWTSLAMERLLPGRPFFQPVAPGAGLLPYLDHTIDVVLVDDPARLDEAARVAAGGAVLVGIDADGGAIAAKIRRRRFARSQAPSPVRILVTTEADDEWLGRLTQAVASRPGVEVRTAEPFAKAVETDAPTIVLAEPGVLPLPGCIEAAERLLAEDQRIGGVAVKLFAADGSLEAAGGAAFADGSVEAIASGASPSAPWHEYVRPVAAAVGLVVLRPVAARQCADTDQAGAVDPAGVSARLWSVGWELLYQPHAAGVRVFPKPEAAASVWPHSSESLPARPDHLDDASWRRLLANDLVGAAR